jgi:hypothetical protein
MTDAKRLDTGRIKGSRISLCRQIDLHSEVTLIRAATIPTAYDYGIAPHRNAFHPDFRHLFTEAASGLAIQISHNATLDMDADGLSVMRVVIFGNQVGFDLESMPSFGPSSANVLESFLIVALSNDIDVVGSRSVVDCRNPRSDSRRFLATPEQPRQQTHNPTFPVSTASKALTVSHTRRTCYCCTAWPPVSPSAGFALARGNANMPL